MSKVAMPVLTAFARAARRAAVPAAKTDTSRSRPVPMARWRRKSSAIGVADQVVEAEVRDHGPDVVVVFVVFDLDAGHVDGAAGLACDDVEHVGQFVGVVGVLAGGGRLQRGAQLGVHDRPAHGKIQSWRGSWPMGTP